ncbi:MULTISPECIES: tungstate ABC transporter ATP-binding protein WtpC [Thermococcus]|uniref:Molybdate/tungstate import ATP-binding protein WtpC n=2 Tax=Thermococcus sibiricus TaxID=172049 RepID=C6A0T6_THESM|nr:MULTISPECIES: tungstate ABC transporter ATP-binding protein WtpC [Thermococcus]KUK28192.1 MAG: ABC transporter, ATP-binding protein [Thermococcus sp. 40_45]HII66427.1 ATP-binding cassette domain-containing protein [Thermococcaceae archaeon]ACS89231.1 ABC transporter, ATP-binding protein [Thermococcus sibiricus MM 739]KUK17463.1 MAG: ABC transporter, ATP-binding protein [Thermococcus sibiricus]MBC7095718.1 ATP-binding cassette domain-containing protein [Thermococcus sp.]
MLRVENISKNWGEFKLHDITFEVKNREYLIILGPSGAGKTLLLELIAGIFVPDSGRIFMNGNDITFLPPEKRKLAYIPQNYALFPHMKVYDNIAYGLKLKKIPKNEIDKKVKEIGEILGISHLLHRKPKTLSGGEAQRVAIARALVLEPKLLLLDEPFANLDIQTRSKLIQEMKYWHKELNFTALHVTHSFEEAVSLGDRVGVMLNGKLIQTGEVREVFGRPKNEEVAKFLGFENIIEGIGEGRVLKTNGILIELPIEVKGKVRIGIRPEDIIISSEPIKSSARNEFKAKVLAVEDLGSLVRLTLDIGGIELRAFITRSSLLEMEIKEDKEVYLSFKATAIHVF